MFLAEKFSCSAMFSKKEFALVVISGLLAGQISCSVVFSMKKKLYSLGIWATFDITLFLID